MVTLRRIGVVSAGRVGFWFGVATTIIHLTILIVLIALLGRVSITQIPTEFWVRALIGAVISGMISAISAMMSAFIYNWIANAFGGLKLEFEMPEVAAEKRKNGEGQETSDGNTNDTSVV